MGETVMQSLIAIDTTTQTGEYHGKMRSELTKVLLRKLAMDKYPRYATKIQRFQKVTGHRPVLLPTFSILLP